jgi:hypothetical protein
MRREVAKNYSRIVRLTLFAIYEAGTASRLAGAAALALRPDVYDDIKAAASRDARLSLKKRISEVLDMIDEGEEGNGDREG